MGYDVGQATASTTLKTGVSDYSVASKTLDVSTSKETRWENSEWTKRLGYYKLIAPLKQAADALADWTVGRGWITDRLTRVKLDRITGWGEDSFKSILWNMLVVKKINGDAYAEIIRDDEGNLINLKPLNPQTMVTIVNKKGIITKYEEMNFATGEPTRSYDPSEIFHISNDRIGNEIHGTSIILDKSP